MIYDYIFIGAGTASLSAANALCDADHDNLLILEKGNLLSKRSCPGIEYNSCLFCKKGCAITDGIGGANALHGNKLCYFPASNKVYSSFDADIRKKTINYMSEILTPYFDENNINSDGGSNIKKEYFSDALNSDHFKDLINILSGKLLAANKIKENTEVVDVIRLKNDEFIVKTVMGDFRTKNVVLGSGRSGVYFNKMIYDKLNIRYTHNTPDIGFRIEADKEMFNEAYHYQVDPKYKSFHHNLGIGRTFCAHNQGFIVPVMFGKSFYADGAFGKTFTNSNNIALMVRTNQPFSPEIIEKWCQTVNRSANESLRLGTISWTKKEYPKLFEKILNIIPSWPTKKHKELMELVLFQFLNVNDYIFKQAPEMGTNSISILGPAIDYYWVKPELDANLSTSIPNVFVIGDAIGVSRGYIQAIVSGIGWVNNRLNNMQSRNADERLKNRWYASV
jgi:uncharacterized protein